MCLLLRHNQAQHTGEKFTQLSQHQVMATVFLVFLILDADPNLGQAIARTFAFKGYKIDLATRSLEEADSTDN